MVRLVGVDIPDSKRFVIALTYIYGIGKTRAENICNVLNIDLKTRTSDISEEVLRKVRDFILKQTEKEKAITKERDETPSQGLPICFNSHNF